MSIAEQDKLNFEDISCLIIDDDKFSRTMIKTALSQIGVKDIFDAEDYANATSLIRQHNLDVILLDQEIPSMNGTEIAKKIRNGEIDPNKKDIPIVMVTIDVKESTVLEAKKLNIKEYLIKPISPIALKKRLNSAISIKKIKA
jgi:two-component system chemotaxis response regulator CheY